MKPVVGFRCPYKGFLCKRVDYFGDPACFEWDMKGCLRFVCKHFVAPKGFTVPKQLSPEDML